jgi:protein TonB
VDFASQQRNPNKHLFGISMVVGLHVVLGWAIVSGLATQVVDVIRAPIETKIIEETKPPPPPPPENLPPPPPRNAPPPPSFVPPPEINVRPPPTPAPTITTTQVAPPPAPPVFIQPPAPPAPPAPAPAPPARVSARPAITDASACAPTARDYPAAAVRAEATGTTVIRFSVGSDGKLTGPPQVVLSAGPSREHKMLDRVAVQKLGGCSFAAGTDEFGRPVGATVDIEYVWRLD